MGFGKSIIRAMSGRLLAVSALAVAVAPIHALALEVVLKDVAPDRVERQRRFTRNELPLPGTPDLAKLDERLKSKGLVAGRPIYIRIFKAESELELWVQNASGTFGRLATYPICHWYGSLGPKLKEGDKQSPEGFYSVGVPQTRLVGRWRRAFNLGFPNRHDQMLSRTGSYILLHGGCSSVGCFAMTDPVQDEIYGLARAALAGGQDRFAVHIFPFRMTDENMARHAANEWAHTWADLKPAYESFERTHVPPRIVLCGLRYKIADGLPGETGVAERRLPVLRPVAHGGPASDPSVVVDEEGNWIAPACELEDEDKRRAYYAAAAGTTPTSAITTATLDKVSEAPPVLVPDNAVPSRASKREEKPESADDQAREKSGSRSARVASESRRASSMRRVPAHPQARRSGDPVSGGGGVPAADGFGSAQLRATQRISAHGG
ncbi:MAG: hypothetical protein R3D44_02530 [Hyphomicrobiaceae bacterium]